MSQAVYKNMLESLVQATRSPQRYTSLSLLSCLARARLPYVQLPHWRSTLWQKTIYSSMSFEEASLLPLASLLSLRRTAKCSIYVLPGEISYFATSVPSRERSVLPSSRGLNEAQQKDDSQEPSPAGIIIPNPYYTEQAGETTLGVSARATMPICRSTVLCAVRLFGGIYQVVAYSVYVFVKDLFHFCSCDEV